MSCRPMPPSVKFKNDLAQAMNRAFPGQDYDADNVTDIFPAHVLGEVERMLDELPDCDNPATSLTVKLGDDDDGAGRVLPTSLVPQGDPFVQDGWALQLYDCAVSADPMEPGAGPALFYFSEYKEEQL